MAEPLVTYYGPEIPRRIAQMIRRVYPQFSTRSFLAEAGKGYDALDLMNRGRKIADALYAFLPKDYASAIEILLQSVAEPPPDHDEESPLASFIYLPHTFYVSRYGLDHFEDSMRAQYLLTQLFTAEFSIRPFLERYEARTLKRLEEWTRDPHPKVRRLVSEGTRPRLPWAPRLRSFQRNPQPVLRLLEMLRDDPDLVVRRSVANNLNDIGKDHPDLLARVARSWMKGAPPERMWVIRHALRSAVKRGEPGALAVLGFGRKAEAKVSACEVSPATATLGDRVTIAFSVTNTRATAQRVLVDFRIHYVKANGSTSPKVFKLKEVELRPGETVRFQKRIALEEMTTRKHYPGRHVVEALLNGNPHPVGAFVIALASKGRRGQVDPASP
jgi:3-methyladenine DNA glycosylase AlkC